MWFQPKQITSLPSRVHSHPPPQGSSHAAALTPLPPHQEIDPPSLSTKTSQGTCSGLRNHLLTDKHILSFFLDISRKKASSLGDFVLNANGLVQTTTATGKLFPPAVACPGEHQKPTCFRDWSSTYIEYTSKIFTLDLPDRIRIRPTLSLK